MVHTWFRPLFDTFLCLLGQARRLRRALFPRSPLRAHPTPPLFFLLRLVEKPDASAPPFPPFIVAVPRAPSLSLMLFSGRKKSVPSFPVANPPFSPLKQNLFPFSIRRAPVRLFFPKKMTATLFSLPTPAFFPLVLSPAGPTAPILGSVFLHRSPPFFVFRSHTYRHPLVIWPPKNRKFTSESPFNVCFPTYFSPYSNTINENWASNPLPAIQK